MCTRQFQMIDCPFPSCIDIIDIYWIWCSESHFSTFYRDSFFLRHDSFPTCSKWVGPIIRVFFVVRIHKPTRGDFTGYISYNVPTHALRTYCEPPREELFPFFQFLQGLPRIRNLSFLVHFLKKSFFFIWGN